MEWNGGNPFLPRPTAQSSFAFVYNYNDHYAYPPVMEMNPNEYEYNMNQDKKKRLTSEQLEALENAFEEEKKLDTDTKMKLAHDLGLQPRQIAVWFQNRRARWKNKLLECMYDTLKQEFDVVSKEKQKLQEEVLALRTILKEQASKRQGAGSSTAYTYMSGEKTSESTSVATTRATTNPPHELKLGKHHTIVATTTAMDVDSNNYTRNYDPTASVPTPCYSNYGVLSYYP